MQAVTVFNCVHNRLEAGQQPVQEAAAAEAAEAAAEAAREAAAAAAAAIAAEAARRRQARFTSYQCYFTCRFNPEPWQQLAAREHGCLAAESSIIALCPATAGPGGSCTASCALPHLATSSLCNGLC